MARRRKTSASAEAENEILSQGRWSGLKDQWFSEAMNHTEAENKAARERSRQLCDGGYGSIDWNGLITWEELLNDE